VLYLSIAEKKGVILDACLREQTERPKDEKINRPEVGCAGGIGHKKRKGKKEIVPAKRRSLSAGRDHALNNTTGREDDGTTCSQGYAYLGDELTD